MVQKRSIIEVDIRDWHVSKSFLGTEDETYREAHDWMNMMILQYLDANDIDDDDEAEAVAETAIHSITFDNDDYLCMYAVFEEDVDEPVVGVFMSRTEAEEMILALCEDYAEEILNFDDPREVYGRPNWHIPEDYWELALDCARCFGIQTIPVYGVEEVL